MADGDGSTSRDPEGSATAARRSGTSVAEGGTAGNSQRAFQVCIKTKKVTKFLSFLMDFGRKSERQDKSSSKTPPWQAKCLEVGALSRFDWSSGG